MSDDMIDLVSAMPMKPMMTKKEMEKTHSNQHMMSEEMFPKKSKKTSKNKKKK